MLIPLLLFWGFALPQDLPSPPQPPAVFVAAADIDATMRQSIANNTLDTRVALAAGARGTVRVGIVHRTTQEPNLRGIATHGLDERRIEKIAIE